MDYFRAFSRRLMSLFFVALFACAGAAFSPPAAAQSSGTFASAWSSCVSWVHSQAPSASCKDNGRDASGGANYCDVVEVGPTGSILNGWPYSCSDAPATHCPTAAGQSGAFQGQLSKGSLMCQPDPSGAFACSMSFTPDSDPFLNHTGTTWATHGSYAPTGSTCTPGAVGPGNGAVPPTQPNRSCGGGSCYDASKNQDCAVNASGAQFCVTRSPTGPSSPGSCVSSGSDTICSGSPKAPPPPAPPASPITDPATQIQASDGYTSSNPATGANYGTGVTTYGVGSAPVTSGQGTGDDGPAKASSSAGNGSASGGSDCNSPPVCTGDAVMCGVMRQQWYTMCSAKTATDQLHKDLAGDGNGPPTLSSDEAKYGQGDVWVQPDTSLNGTTGGQANQGVYDQSGFGFSRTCPLQDIQFTSIPFVAKFSAGCDVLEGVGLVLVGFALFIAACITRGSNH